MATQINLPNKEKTTIIYGKAYCKYMNIAAYFISNSVYRSFMKLKFDILLINDNPYPSILSMY